ncbi:MAG TPA: cytochrome c biogenesis protein CcdA [Thermoanaerobaculia bacterium]|jgi:thiol:disulfide interchange protein DsbD|nr:cytochrome c biogenesis protein CcdA [Thermoanaerobaculia bacterium]
MKKVLAALLLFLPALAAAQRSASLMTAAAAAAPSSVLPGGSFTLTIEGALAPGWHVNAHEPSEDYLIPTEAKITAPAGLTFSAFSYPPARTVKFSFSEKPLAVYAGKFSITATGTAPKNAAAGAHVVEGVLSFQPCNDQQCLAPASVPFRASVTVSATAAGAASFSAGTPAGAGAGAAPSGDFGAMLSQRGWLVGFLVLFLGGLALNLTPCVYPIIPITIGFFGGQSRGKTGRPVGLAAAYVLGMAFTYSTLGVVAALSGKLFGSALQSPWVLGGIAAVLVALSLSMFGLYDINPPRFVMDRAGAKTGFGGAFGMGLLVGVVAAPCLGPFVLGLLTFVAARRDPVLGFLMFFVLSIGLGLPYLFLASFSGAITKLPRAGAWMVEVKKVFGFVLLAMAAYFGKFLVPEPARRWIVPAVLVVGALYLLFAALRSQAPPMARAAVSGAAIVFLGAAGWFARPQGGQPLPFAPYDAARVAGAARPVMIDFSADWCAPCHELEDETFADPRVRRALSGTALFKADMTRQDSPEAIALSTKFNVQGMPTVIFLDASGREIPGSRLVGFEPPARFLQRLSKISS